MAATKVRDRRPTTAFVEYAFDLLFRGKSQVRSYIYEHGDVLCSFI